MTGRLRRRGRCRDEGGAALELALLFLTGTVLVVTALLSFASTSSSSTVVTRTSRGGDYDTDAAMQTTIAYIRVHAAEGTLGSCLTGGFTPPLTLNNPGRPLRVDCAPSTAPSQQRRVILAVCPASVAAPCPDVDALLRADVKYYDDGTIGRALSIVSWSNQ